MAASVAVVSRIACWGTVVGTRSELWTVAAAMTAADGMTLAALAGPPLNAELARRGVGLLGRRAPEEILGDLHGQKLVWE